jgi:signal transduction histidine kinase/ActR/RegA family two-component response regulator
MTALVVMGVAQHGWEAGRLWNIPRADLAMVLGVMLLLTLCFGVIFLLSHLMWKQKERIEASTLVVDQAYQELRVSERSRSELLASVTHELKTPLVTVRGYIDLALRGELQSPVRAGLQVARRSALRLQRLIEELLIAADPKNLGAELVPGEVGLHELLGEEIANFSNQAASQNVTIIQVSDSKQDTIWADRERVGQVISNLINNALRYSPEGGVIEVGARPHSAADMLVWVSDQGKGIEPEKLKHLFEEHYVRGTEARSDRGMGLGLLICKKLVTAMGGRISVASQTGVGTTFSVTFPRKSTEKQAPAMQTVRQLRALVLDDESDVLSLMEYHLVTAGYEVALFQNGTAAYESAMREEFDLLFLDVNVPGITGVEVSRRLREAGRPGRILLFSALIRNDAERLLVEARADGFLPKPFDFDQISHVLDEARAST